MQLRNEDGVQICSFSWDNVFFLRKRKESHSEGDTRNFYGLKLGKGILFSFTYGVLWCKMG
jgi:hypothetical protein